MKIYLIIATVARQKSLRQLLQSLTQQSWKNFEIILCDQNSDNTASDIINSLQHTMHIRHLKNLPPGVSGARNAGLQLLPIDDEYIVGFPDDDCLYEEDTLANVHDYFLKHSQCGALLGNWLPVGQKFPSGSEEKINQFNVFYKGGTLVQFFLHKKSDLPCFFDLQLGPGINSQYGCGEDTDFLLQFMKAFPERQIMRVPGVHLRHPEAAESFSKEKIYKYAAGRMYLLKKHHFGLFFRMFTVLYPLGILLFESPAKYKYRWQMFCARLSAFFNLKRI